jgi:alcohol dehydrogenase class IV
MRTVQIHFPAKFVFGDNCLNDFIDYFLSLPYKRVFLIIDPHIKQVLELVTDALDMDGIEVIIGSSIEKEPTESEFLSLLNEAESKRIDSVIGIGGGSVLDVAKLLAAMSGSGQDIASAYGSGNLAGRKLFLACLPTTAGTGSEVSPNAILMDEKANLKKAVVSPFLLPDATYVDPVLTYTVPPDVTAATGLDALTHCIEVYANKYAHSITDLYALEGIRLIYKNLERAFRDGRNAEARRELALGSVYGGLGLGPVNTAAVHAIAYPLGSEYRIAHGISNALLLTHVLEYNLAFGAERYAQIARAIGVQGYPSDMETAREGIRKIGELCQRLGIPGGLEAFNVPASAVPSLARSAMTIQRLLKNNLRDLSLSEVEQIYYKLF